MKLFSQFVCRNEEGEEHLHQRRQQLPFNLATGEGVLYDISLDAFSIPGPPGSDAPGTMEPTTPLDPASLLGSLRRQDRSVYIQPQKPSPQLPIFTQIEDLDLEGPQPSLEQAFLDSHALLSVPGQIQASQNRSVTGDPTSEAMIGSLEQILGDIGDGGIEGLEVEETELRDWENAIIRMSNEREDASQLNHILANDVFSYVEEALRRETGGCVQGSDHVSGNSLSIQGQQPGSAFSNIEQPMTDMTSGFAEQTLLGGVLGGVGCSTGLKSACQVVSHRAAPTQCRDTHQGHTSRPWPPSSCSGSHQCGNQTISTQSCRAAHSQPDATQQSWLPSAHDNNNIHGSRHCGSEMTNQSAQRKLNHISSQLQSPSLWQQQQLPPSLHHHTLTHSSHTPGGVNSTAQSFHPQTQRLSGSCMHEKREGHIPNAATGPTGHNGPVRGRSGCRGPTQLAGTTSFTHPGVNQGVLQASGSNMAACTDVGNISLVHLSGGLGPARSEYPPENGSPQSSFFCWNGEAQVK